MNLAAANFRFWIWRDSVCAGDDCDAPHEIERVLPLAATLAEFTAEFLDKRYLATISGGKATWVLEGRGPLAVYAQQWASPRFLVEPTMPLADAALPDGKPSLRFRYRTQEDPEIVFQTLNAVRVV